ncbi:MAG: DNA-directed RNA polymerase subunit alpha [Candidatus Marinimicrobia bacterium]|jgi:DNA-directed RNA polymerase subunit alpha|nr:DNA-directed RNA polymerase subunit alpha [Candidatus Neomarinimicrobiota bacterium]MBT4318021.1 DNA-directed RNA polymerase subunit alpha [Candidatus Neomarinimicrobiota bacterium]MBT4784213.1 DNA-directed RNA polymerase subunit alpha [Candidatus Neomarinimicrobiota bacterium]MBT5097366.1 DNA-directed RNA polymerase subunit alpha [Candidatus Neomarinimicrobiota bacterium]MBT5440599.1 DNA-directed RNA polymerase subunit alpha [Candidatus Neomarinimicrobiota bacterium]|tara:strand:- start:2108 stop:3082 length:975 start_codon:yes stop_codon:yes gene_type:complete
MGKKEYDLKIKTDNKSLTKTYGKFIVQPLERGYGVTVGNALRRVLLTSLPGAAITNVKVEGVLHEFSTIPGVKDDMADIIQNLKGVRFRLTDSDVDNVTVTLKGKKKLTAADIQSQTDEFEVLNKDHYITELNSKGSIQMEIRVGVGKGYVPSEENDLPNAPIGTLAIDSIFNPVTKVTYNVQPVPGAKDPIEILNIEVETDGSVTPEDAISYSATVLMNHLRLVEAIAKPEVLEVTEKISEEIIKIRNLLNLTIDEMELSVRSHNCLQAAGIKYIYELVSKEENQMLKYKNFGRKSLTELVEKLDEMGISFGMDVDKYLKLEV